MRYKYRFFQSDNERDWEWDNMIADDKAIRAYQELQEKDPENDLLKLATITKRGFWIFKQNEIDISPEHIEEFTQRYSPGKKMYPLSMSSYASDLETAIKGKK